MYLSGYKAQDTHKMNQPLQIQLREKELGNILSIDVTRLKKNKLRGGL